MTNRFAKISQKELDEFLEARLIYTGTNKAIAQAKVLGFNDSDCQTLVIEKLKRLKTYQDISDSIINQSIKTNVVKFNDKWYGIICMSKNHKDMMVNPLTHTNIKSIVIDFVNTRAKSRDEYEQFVKDNLDKEELECYKNKVLRKKDEILKEFLNCTNNITKNNKTYIITQHCILRWEERINNNETKKIHNKKRENIIYNIDLSFQRSMLVYENKTEETKFYLDKKLMIFFVVSSNNVIMSLWRNDYGFTDTKINDMATFMQLEYIKLNQKKYDKNLIQYNKKINELKLNENEIRTDIDKISLQINDLTEQKNKMVEIKNTIIDNIKNVNDFICEEQKSLSKEESLVFRAHKKISKTEKIDTVIENKVVNI